MSRPLRIALAVRLGIGALLALLAGVLLWLILTEPFSLIG